ncbi:MAG: hypothetical protein ABI297_06120 [Ginsengibacter sp.]
MKYIVSLLFSLLTAGLSFAQSPMKTLVEYNGQKYPCFIMEYNLPPEEVQNVIQQKMKLQGYNAEKSKGFLVYKSVRLKDLDSEVPQDVLFSIDRKNRKEKDKSVVTLITAKSGLIPEGKVKGAPTVANIESSANSIPFFESFQSDMNLQQYNLAISSQEAAVADAEKKLKGLKEDQSKLERKIKDYQNDLGKNQNEQADQLNEVQKQQTLLQQIKTAKPLN